MIIVRKTPQELTPKERKSCYSMSYHNSGDISTMLNLCLHQNAKGLVWLAYEDNIIVGWAIVMTKDMFGAGDRRCPWFAKGYYGMWVRRSHRRRGIAQAILREVRRGGRVIIVQPHDVASTALYSKYNNSSRVGVN